MINNDVNNLNVHNEKNEQEQNNTLQNIQNTNENARGQDYKYILIYSKEGSYCFDKNCYNEEALEGIITKYEFLKIVEEASKIMGNALLTKRKLDHFEVSNWTICISCFSLSLVVVYLFLIYLAQGSTNNGETYLVISIILVTVAISVTFIQSIYNFCRKTRKYRTLDEIIKTELDNYFENINNTYYFSKINNKYIFTGSLHFQYLEGKKIIECTVERANLDNNFSIYEEDKKDNYITESREIQNKINELNKLDKINHMHVGKFEIEMQQSIKQDEQSQNNKSMIIHEEGELESERKKFSEALKGHYRVKSALSSHSNRINMTGKEIEIELNKTRSLKS